MTTPTKPDSLGASDNRILRAGDSAIRFEYLGDLLNCVQRKGEKSWGWVDDRLIECYPGGRRIDWTKVYRKMAAWKLADSMEVPNAD